MKEFLIEVNMDGEIETLKSYCVSPVEALDSMISFENISQIYKITDTTNNKSWEFDNSDLEKLRELRGLISDDKIILQTLRGQH